MVCIILPSEEGRVFPRFISSVINYGRYKSEKTLIRPRVAEKTSTSLSLNMPPFIAVFQTVTFFSGCLIQSNSVSRKYYCVE